MEISIRENLLDAMNDCRENGFIPEKAILSADSYSTFIQELNVEAHKYSQLGISTKLPPDSKILPATSIVLYGVQIISEDDYVIPAESPMIKVFRRGSVSLCGVYEIG